MTETLYSRLRWLCLILPCEDSAYIHATALVADGGLTGAAFGVPILRG
jgi:hypothetical protein